MIRRIIAAIAALVLAGVGAFLVTAYASRADERAISGLETVEILVAQQTIPEGTTAEGLSELVLRQQVPVKFLAEGVVDDLADLEGRLLTTPISRGEQLLASRFVTPEELRAQDEFVMPEEAKDLHQVTIPLAKPRALGGNIAAGDTVGVFVSIEPKDEGAGNMTHLTLHKVLVLDVQGGYVEPPSGLTETEAEAEERTAADTVLVTLALSAPDAEKLVFAMEYGQVWLSYEPENADEDGTDIVVVTVPDDVRDVFE